MQIPEPRGPLTSALFDALRGNDPSLLPAAPQLVPTAVLDEDLQLALWTCYELHYRGFVDVPAGWEWQPELLGLRNDLESLFLDELRHAVSVPVGTGRIADRLRDLVAADDGPQLARFVQRKATREQFIEFVVHRSVYHLKEGDPHSWAIPRLCGRAKAALIEIQADEYGGGRLDCMHSELFRRTLRGLGLDDSYGRYVDAVPGVTLAVSNLISLFGLHREFRGAVAGHLAAFEMTSSGPNRRYSKGLLRLGGDERTRRFYDEHVTADALHEQLAAHDLCGGLVGDEPALTDDVLFGAAACLHVDNQWAEHVLRCWTQRRTSLRAEHVAAGIPTADVS